MVVGLRGWFESSESPLFAKQAIGVGMMGTFVVYVFKEVR